VGPDGRAVRDKQTLQRIKSLVIPPAWTDVWICPDPRGHLQAVGRDARGRKQYRYHPRWQAVRAAAKFERMQAFGEALPRIRRKIAALLRHSGMPRDKVLAALVQLLDLTLIRVGNDEYARKNRSYGLTTLLTRHAGVEGKTVRFEFTGKSGVPHNVALRHAGLASFVRDCIELPGRELFQYVDDRGRRRSVSAADVNAFLQSIAGTGFTAKDFRTWGASVLALRALRKRAEAPPAQAKRNVVATVREVAEKLGNTPAVCRKSYLHPQLLDAYRNDPAAIGALRARTLRGMRNDESLLLEFLRSAPPMGASDAAALPESARVVRLRKGSQPAYRRHWTPGRGADRDRIAA
jgi:DNA topoisomerase-1